MSIEPSIIRFSHRISSRCLCESLPGMDRLSMLTDDESRGPITNNVLRLINQIVANCIVRIVDKQRHHYKFGNLLSNEVGVRLQEIVEVVKKPDADDCHGVIGLFTQHVLIKFQRTGRWNGWEIVCEIRGDTLQITRFIRISEVSL